VSTLYTIVSELGISFDDLFSPAAGERRIAARHPRTASGEEHIVIRADERPVIELESGVTWERLNPTGEPDVDFLEVGFHEHELGPGDSICFDSAVPHRLETLGEEPARAIWFVIGRAGSDARAQWPRDESTN
jgi:hypothetical protein